VDWEPEAPAPSHFSLYGNKDDRGTSRALLFANEEVLAARETLNLLYVAMTRARQVLFVSGVESTRGGDESWYRLIADAVGAAETKGVELALDGAAKRTTEPPPAPVKADPALRRPLEVGNRTDSLVDPRRRHGVLLHVLLERLAPPSEVSDREFLRETLAVSEEEFEKLWKDAHAILSEPDLQRFFDPKRYLRAHNELAYVAESGELRRIDRLVEFDDAVWVLDYKTGDSVDPDDLATAARPYRSQLAEYRAAVGGLFSGKPVKSALVFGGGLLHVTDT
jgi:ATP-dependent helicase/nuclease subunit A